MSKIMKKMEEVRNEALKQIEQMQREKEAEEAKKQAQLNEQKAFEQKRNEELASGLEPKTKELFSALDEIDSKYDSDTSELEKRLKFFDELDLQEKEDVVIDEEKIGQDVTNSVSKVYDKKKEDVVSNAKALSDELNDSKEKLSLSNADKQSNVKRAYDNAKIAQENEALKRGLARSSIVINQLSQIEGAKANELSTLQNELVGSLDGIEKELQSLERKKNASLSDLDLELAIEIDETINKKLDEMKKAQDEVLEYNNKIKEIESKFNIDLEETRVKNDLYSNETKQKIFEEWENKRSSEKVDAVSNYLNSLPQKQALALLVTNRELASRLGSSFSAVYLAQMKRT